MKLDLQTLSKFKFHLSGMSSVIDNPHLLVKNCCSGILSLIHRWDPSHPTRVIKTSKSAKELSVGSIMILRRPKAQNLSPHSVKMISSSKT